ncbi:MAG TPA: hypothetical protein VFL57_04370 [Bryobacteraceae bacterium]|nr:hypothetical protein [Bryobacteraceae bacterium]
MRPVFEIATIAAILVGGIGAIRWIAARTHGDPVERERRRRLKVGRQGRLVDGFIVDIIDTSVLYSYAVAGVEYQAAQDLSAVRSFLSEPIESLVGPVTIRYLPSNPSNSVILTEEWSGFRTKPPHTLSKGA